VSGAVGLPFLYSVLLPVYKGDRAEWLKIAVDSMLAQTLPPEEIFIAVDGAVGADLSATLNEYEASNPRLFTVKRYAENEGLGKLLNKTLPLCRNEWVVRMDADDYSLPERIEKQFTVLKENPDISVVGCNVDEFYGDVEGIVARVILPETPEEVYSFAKRRCPIRHPALLYKKSDVLASGNYTVQDYVQDYDLVVKLLLRGYKFFNIQEPLVRMRVSKNFYKRRGGLRYLKCIHKAKKHFYKSGFLSLGEYIISFYGHAVVIMMPGWLRELVYKYLLRKKS